MKQAQQLYFLAIIPPQPIYEKVMDYKQLFASEYGSKAALKSPPHITLHMPFKLKPQHQGKLVQVLEDVAHQQEIIEVKLEGFGHFNERTVFIDVAENESLHSLFKLLMKAMKVNFNVFNADYKNRGYNPHMTLAFRDLKRESFKAAWPEFKRKDYDATFGATSLVLLKHNGKYWEIFKEMNFGQ